METSIVVAIITGGISLIGTIITVLAAGRKQAQEFAVQQAVTATKIENLTTEVRKHNNFAERLPVCENDIKTIYHELDEIKENIK